MYKTGSIVLGSGLELMNPVMKLVMSCCLGRRPTISAEPYELHEGARKSEYAKVRR